MKYKIVLILFFSTYLFQCCSKQKKIKLTNVSEIENNRYLKQALKNILNPFIIEHEPYLEKEQTFLISFLIKSNDTLIYLSRTYKFEVIKETNSDEFKGGFYYQKKYPVLIVDDIEKPVGSILYNIDSLDHKIVEEYDKYKHPSNFIIKSFTKKFIKKGDSLIFIENQKIPDYW